MDDIVEAVNPSVVTVYTYTPTFSPGSSGRAPNGAGSGWVFTDDGYVITNAHVVLDVESVKVMTFGGDLIPATVVGTDWYQDVAVLKLEPEDHQTLPPAVAAGDSSRLYGGDEIIAIGTPGGQFANTVSVGEVAGVGRSIDPGSGYTIQNLIQHSAALLPGNSGGPLFSMDGDVVGINVASRDLRDSAALDLEEISFAIEANAVVSIANEIIASGSVNRPYLGLTSELVSDGQLVLDVEADSPADEAGLQAGDVIIGIENLEVNADGWFIDLLFQHNPGDSLTLEIDRNEDVMTVEVVAGSRPPGS